MSKAKFVPESAKVPGTLPPVAGSIAVALVVPALVTVLKSELIVLDPTVDRTVTLLPAAVGAKATLRVAD